MWVLLMIIMGSSHYAQSAMPIVIEKYRSEAKCESEKKRIWTEMKKAYPENQNDFYFECRMKGI